MNLRITNSSRTLPDCLLPLYDDSEDEMELAYFEIHAAGERLLQAIAHERAVRQDQQSTRQCWVPARRQVEFLAAEYLQCVEKWRVDISTGFGCP